MRIFNVLFLDPIYHLYIHLPYVGWEGKFESQICAAMTGIHERHWLFAGSEECVQMIDRNFSSKIIVFQSILQLYILLSTSADIIFFVRRKILTFFFMSIVNDTVRE